MEKAKATTNDLLTDYAVEQWFFALMFGRGDMDLRLQELGIVRKDLRILMQDDEIGAAMETRREAVISTPWHLEPNDTQDSEWLYTQIRPHIENILRCSWSAVPFGYSVGELVYRKLEGGRLGLRSVVEKPFWWFIPEVDGTLRYLSPDKSVEFVDTSVKFMLTVREQTYDQPYGKALLPSLYSAWFFRTHGWRFWMQFLERVGIPFLLGETAGDTESFSTELRKAAQGGTLAIPIGDKVSMLSSQMSGDHFSVFDVGVSKRIQKLILGQTLTSDTQGVGSQALGKVHDAVREDRRNSDIRLCTRSVQMVIDALWSVNKLPGMAPEFVMEDDQGIQTERADRDAKLVNAGIVKLSEDYILRTYDYEKGEVEIPESQPIPPALGGQNGQVITDPQGDAPAFYGDHGVQFASRNFTRDQQYVEDLVAASLKAAEQPIDPEIIRRAIQAASGPEDLEDRLAVLLQTDDKALFRRYLERGLFAADVMGYAHAGD